jgi:23S rRNA pseudouridine2605 synthase
MNKAVSQKSNKLQKMIADRGLASRREAEKWIEARRVKVNGEVAHLGQRVSAYDLIEIDDQTLTKTPSVSGRVLLLNKPVGVICSRKDELNRSSVFDNLPTLISGRWVSVGRLDLQSSGVLLFSTDGQLADKLMHPSGGLDREYAVRVRGRLDEAQLDLALSGANVDGEQLRFSDIRFFNGSSSNSWYHVVLMGGKNREIRRLFEFLGNPVSRLKRVRYGPVIVPSWLKTGQYTELNLTDVSKLYRLVGLSVPDKNKITRKSRDSKYQATKSCLIDYPNLV